MTSQGGDSVVGAVASADVVDPWIGRVIGDRYRVERKIGEGSSGTVYLAEHVTLSEKVAVKILQPALSQSPELLQRFEREAIAAAKMRHPNVVAAIDFGREPDGAFYLVLEYVEGETLRDAIEKGMFEPLRATRCLRQIAMALERAHGMGVVHRDLKPENVVLSRTPEGEEIAKVLDFGIAKVPHLFGSQGKVSTQRGMIYGTPEYMAPEQALGQEVEARADLYALGVMAYELYVGKRPFDDDNKVALLGKHITATIPPFLDRNPMVRLPPLVEPLVRSLLAKNQNERASDAKTVREELDKIVLALTPPGSSPAEYVSPLSAPPPAADSRPLGALLHKTSEGLKSFSQSEALRSADESTKKWVTEGKRQAASLLVEAKKKPKQAAAIASAVFALLFLCLAAMCHGTGSNTVSPSASASASGAMPPVDNFAEGEKAFANKEYTTALSYFVSAGEKSPGDARVLASIFATQLAIGEKKAALETAEAWVRADPNVVKNEKFRKDLEAIAGTKEAAPLAFAFFESALGSLGIDWLYEYAFITLSNLTPRAKTSLGRREVRERGSDALRMAYEFRQAQSCDAKKKLLPKAQKNGDIRTLDQLRALQNKTGCRGFAGKVRDCFPCMRRDKALDQTVAALEARVNSGRP